MTVGRVGEPWGTPERLALRESAGIGGGATEVLNDVAGRLLGYAVVPPPARGSR